MKYITKIDSFITYIGWTNFNIPTYQTIYIRAQLDTPLVISLGFI